MTTPLSRALTAAATVTAVLAILLTTFEPATAGGDKDPGAAAQAPAERKTKMQLGAFSVSLAVKDLAASRAFYEKLGFEQVAGNPAHNYLILRNGSTVIGLFHGMFEKNVLTFNPGWDQAAQPLETFEDVRDIQSRLKEGGVELTLPTDPEGSGPAHITMVDPDGNPVLIDQHVPKPK